MARYLTNPARVYMEGGVGSSPPCELATCNGPAVGRTGGLAVLIAADVRHRAESLQAEGLSPEAALLLPLVVSLARLQARQAYKARKP